MSAPASNWRAQRRQRLQSLAGWVCAVIAMLLAVLLMLDAAQAAEPAAQPVAVVEDARGMPAPPAAASAYRALLTRAAHSQWGLDAPIAALAAQVHQESGWRPTAVSRVGARGLGQFMPATASWWCELNKLPADECQPENPRWALRALVGYDRWLYERTPRHYSARDRMWVALRAYNGGLGHWQAEARQAVDGSRAAVDAACGRAKRHPLHCPENLGYPARILQVLQPRYASWGPQA